MSETPSSPSAGSSGHDATGHAAPEEELSLSEQLDQLLAELEEVEPGVLPESIRPRAAAGPPSRDEPEAAPEASEPQPGADADPQQEREQDPEPEPEAEQAANEPAVPEKPRAEQPQADAAVAPEAAPPAPPSSQPPSESSGDAATVDRQARPEVGHKGDTQAESEVESGDFESPQEVLSDRASTHSPPTQPQSTPPEASAAPVEELEEVEAAPRDEPSHAAKPAAAAESSGDTHADSEDPAAGDALSTDADSGGPESEDELAAAIQAALQAAQAEAEPQSSTPAPPAADAEASAAAAEASSGEAGEQVSEDSLAQQIQELLDDAKQEETAAGGEQTASDTSGSADSADPMPHANEPEGEAVADEAGRPDDVLPAASTGNEASRDATLADGVKATETGNATDPNAPGDTAEAAEQAAAAVEADEPETRAESPTQHEPPPEDEPPPDDEPSTDESRAIRELDELLASSTQEEAAEQAGEFSGNFESVEEVLDGSAEGGEPGSAQAPADEPPQADAPANVAPEPSSEDGSDEDESFGDVFASPEELRNERKEGGATAEDVAAELDDEPEAAATAETAAASVSREGHDSPSRVKQALARSRGVCVRVVRLEPYARRVCFHINRPLNRLPSEYRSTIGYVGLLTLINAGFLLLYNLFT